MIKKSKFKKFGIVFIMSLIAITNSLGSINIKASEVIEGDSIELKDTVEDNESDEDSINKIEDKESVEEEVVVEDSLNTDVVYEDQNVIVGTKEALERAGHVITTVPTGYKHTGTATAPNGQYTWFQNVDIPYIYVDGKLAICIEPWAFVGGGTNYVQSLYTDLEIQKLIYHGIDMSNINAYDYSMTELLIWEMFNYKPNSHTVPNFEQAKANILNKVANHKTRPSWHDSTITLKIGESVTLTDTNNSLGVAELFSNVGGIQYSIEGNKLTITATTSSSSGALILNKYPFEHIGIPYVYNSSDSMEQAVLEVGKTDDPVSYRINIEVLKHVDITLHKEDLETGSLPQGDASLAGAVFGYYLEDGTLLQEATIGEDLTLKFSTIQIDQKGYIQEISAGEGYITNDTKYLIDPMQLLTDGTVGNDLQYETAVKNQVMKRGVDGVKVSTDGALGVMNPVAGAEFTYKLKSEVDLVGWDNAKTLAVATTDEYGRWSTGKVLPYGDILQRETITPPNMFTVPDQVITVEHDSDIPIYIYLNDAPYKSYLQVGKYDETTEQMILKRNVSFQIFYADGTLYKEKDGLFYKTTFVTDENGVFETSKPLSAGDYYLVEEETLENFLQPKDKYPFTIDDSNEVVRINEEDNYPVIHVKVYNERPTAELELTKVFESPEENSLLTAGFEVRVRDEEISPVDGSILYEAGEVIKNTNSEDGLWHLNHHQTQSISNIYFGIDDEVVLILEEKVTPEGYKPLDGPIEVVFTKDNDTQKVYTQSVDIENNLYHPTIGTRATGINGEKVLDPTVENTLIDVSDIKDIDPSKTYTIITRLHSADGTIVMERIYTDITFEEADALFTSELNVPANELVEGKYYFSETIYEKGRDNLEVDEPIAEHNDPEDVDQTIHMESPKHLLHVNKTDSLTKQLIVSSKFVFEFRAYNQAGELVDTFHVNGNEETGIATLEFSGRGTYAYIEIQEVEAPVGFLLSEEVITVHAEQFDENNTYTIEYFNTPLPSDEVTTGVSLPSSQMIWYILCGLSSLVVVGAFYAKKRKRKE